MNKDGSKNGGAHMGSEVAGNLEFRPEQILPTNVKYEGQWILNTMIREGRGR